MTLDYTPAKFPPDFQAMVTDLARRLRCSENTAFRLLVLMYGAAGGQLDDVALRPPNMGKLQHLILEALHFADQGITGEALYQDLRQRIEGTK